MQDRLATHRKVPTRCQTARLQATQALEGSSKVRAGSLEVYIANTQVQRQRASRACEVSSSPIPFVQPVAEVCLGTEGRV